MTLVEEQDNQQPVVRDGLYRCPDCGLFLPPAETCERGGGIENGVWCPSCGDLWDECDPKLVQAAREVEAIVQQNECLGYSDAEQVWRDRQVTDCQGQGQLWAQEPPAVDLAAEEMGGIPGLSERYEEKVTGLEFIPNLPIPGESEPGPHDAPAGGPDPVFPPACSLCGAPGQAGHHCPQIHDWLGKVRGRYRPGELAEAQVDPARPGGCQSVPYVVVTLDVMPSLETAAAIAELVPALIRQCEAKARERQRQAEYRNDSAHQAMVTEMALELARNDEKLEREAELARRYNEGHEAGRLWALEHKSSPSLVVQTGDLSPEKKQRIAELLASPLGSWLPSGPPPPAWWDIRIDELVAENEQLREELGELQHRIAGLEK